MNNDAIFFFSGAAHALPVYQRLEEEILARCPETQVIVQKSQIAFSGKHRFAFASIKGKRFVVTFGLPERAEHPRIWQATEPYPGRWTHHVVVQRPEDVDEQLLAWIQAAYDFAMRK